MIDQKSKLCQTRELLARMNGNSPEPPTVCSTDTSVISDLLGWKNLFKKENNETFFFKSRAITQRALTRCSGELLSRWSALALSAWPDAARQVWRLSLTITQKHKKIKKDPDWQRGLTVRQFSRDGRTLKMSGAFGQS